MASVVYQTGTAPASAAPREDAGTPLLALSGITKEFPGIRALDQVSLELRAGEVVALVGENGAGKSTLVKILTGIYRPDSGEIRIDGHPVALASAQDAWRAGITAIHQETAMFDELSVAENIWLGHPPRRAGGLVDWAAMRAGAAALLRRLESNLSPDLPLKHLSVAQKHIVEIARALSHDARVLIMDEPTAALSQHEIEDLYRIVEQLRREGKAIVFISHKFEEIFAVAERYVVLRDGRNVGVGAIAETTRDRLVALMVGRDVGQVFPKIEVPLGEPVLDVEGLGNDTEFADVSFTLRRGEILGFYGLVGAGRSELMEAIFGISPPRRGTVRVHGKPVRIRRPKDAIRAGIVYVPEDRQVAGAILPLSIRHNITLPTLRRITGGIRLSRRRELAVTRELGHRLSVKAAHWDQLVESLSGGNQQKVVIGKWLAARPDIIILDEPTKGIDIGSKAAVHAFMSELVREGLSVILVSSELPEVLGMSDTVLVMHQGRIVRRFARHEASPEAVVSAATGHHAPESFP